MAQTTLTGNLIVLKIGATEIGRAQSVTAKGLRHYSVMGNENSEYRGKPEMVTPRHKHNGEALTTTKERPEMDGGIVLTAIK